MTEYFSSDFEPFGVLEFSDQDPITMRIYDSLREDLGPAFQQPDQDAETFADAMCLGISQLQLEGAAAQDDPDQINGLIAEVEKDYGIIPHYGATLNERREALKTAMTAARGALTPVVFDGLTAILGSDFIFWRPIDFDTEVTLETLAPTFVSPLTPIRVIEIDQIIFPGTQTVQYTRILDDGNTLQNGDRLMVDVASSGIVEPVIVSNANSVGAVHSFTATFANSHLAPVRATTAPQPRWVSNKCHSVVVVAAAALENPTQIAEIHAFMRKVMPTSSTWAITDTDPVLGSAYLRLMIPGSLRIGQTVIAPRVSGMPIDVDDYLTMPTPAALWDVSSGATVTASTVAELFGDELSAWTRTGIGTVTTGVVGARTGDVATQMMQSATTGYHGIDMGWSGTAIAGTSIVVEVLAKTIGSGVYLWFRDGWDNIPTFKASGNVINVTAGTNASAWVIEADDYGAGWYLYRMIARGLFHEPIDASVMLSIMMGDSSGFAGIVGDTGKGMVVQSVRVHQNRKLVSLADEIGIADLAADVTNPPEVRASGCAAVPDIWAPNGELGLASTTNATVLSGYDTGDTSTTAIMFGVYEPAVSAYSLVLSRSDGLSFSFGLTTDRKIWVGIYGVDNFVTPDAVPYGDHHLAVTFDDGHAAVYLDGEPFCLSTPAATGTPDKFSLVVARDSAIASARVFLSKLTDAQIMSVARDMNPQFAMYPSATRPIYSGTLHDNCGPRRLALSESIWELDGTIDSIDLEYQDDFGYAGNFGPTVLADGVKVQTYALTGTPGAYTDTLTIPAGTTRLTLRNGPRGAAALQAYFTSVTFSGVATRILPSPPAHRLLVVGDSVANGWNSTSPTDDGWAALLKDEKANGRVTVYGYGGYAFADEASIVGWLARWSSELASMLDGTTSNSLVFALCINDAMGGGWGGGGGAAGYGAAVALLLDAVHALSPATDVYLWGPHLCTNALGSSEATVSPFRAALLGVVTGRTSWCSVIDASGWTVAMDDTDATHLHPSSAGHATIKSNMQSALSWA